MLHARLFCVGLLAVSLAAASGAAPPRLDRPPRHLTVGKVWCADLSPDGRKVAAACGQYGTAGQVIVWDVPSGQPLWRRGEKNGVRSLAFSPDGKLLAVALYEGPAQLLDPTTGQVRQTLQGQKGALNAIAFFPDGTRLVSAGLDSVIRIWNMKTGKELQALRGHPHFVLSVAVSPDGRTLVSCGGDTKHGGKPGEVKLWDVASGRVRATLVGHTSVVECVAFAPDGKTVASGSWDWTVRLWSAETGQPQRVLHTKAGGGMSVQFAPDSKTVAAVGCNLGGGVTVLGLWEVATGRQLQTIRHGQPMPSVRFSADGKTLVTGCWDSTVRLWEVATGEQRQRFGDLVNLWTSRKVSVAPAPLSSRQWCARLGSRDAAEAYRAVWALADGGESAVKVLQASLRDTTGPVSTAANSVQVAHLLTQLDDDQVQQREAAFEKLAALGRSVAPALRKTFQGPSSAEVHLRVGLLLDRLTGSTRMNPSTLLHLRAIEALEHSGSPTARAVLQELAQATDDAPVRREARAALERLRRHGNKPGLIAGEAR